MNRIALLRSLPFLRRRSQTERDQRALADVIRNTPYFDADWYARHAGDAHDIDEDAALHYVIHGRRYGLEPGPHFSARKYLERYPDVAAHDIAPLVHYLIHGQHENREIEGEPLPAGAAQKPMPALSLSRNERRTIRKQARVIESSDYFDTDWYLKNYFGGRRKPRDPAFHYLTEGARSGFDPGPRFSGQQYLVTYPDVAAEGVNPLLHFVLHGLEEGREAFASFRLPELGAGPTREVAAVTAPPARPANTPSILFVSGEPDTPGHYYRVLNYMEAARENGWRTDCIRTDELADRMAEVARFDHMVMWRAPWDPAIAEAVGIMRNLGKTVIFDCDDLMTEPRLATAQFVDGIRSQLMPEEIIRDHFGRLRETMLAADLCFTTTDQLAFHMRWSGKTTFVNPNGFNQATHDLSRISARDWEQKRDGLVRIGYAGGSRTHQKDLGQAMGAIVQILREYPQCRLVLFRTPDGRTPLIDVEEYPELSNLHGQIEWRPLQPLPNLPTEMARFDINLAPLEVGNPFCQAKSELKFFEAALVNCPTVASPTGPFRNAIRHGETGFLAAAGDDWYACLETLVLDSDLRQRIGRNAYQSALAHFGPRRRALAFGCVLDQLLGGRVAARSFAVSASLAGKPAQRPRVFPSATVFENNKGGQAEVAVIIPLYNYASVVIEALDSVRNQTLCTIDLIIVDGFSTDNSLEVAVNWAHRNADRFNRIVVLKNLANYGLGFCRNSGFDTADTPYVLPLDADNRLRPDCAEKLLATIKQSGSAYIYPTIQHFGSSTALISDAPYNAQRFVAGNYVDAMALVSKEAWAMIGGYDHVRYGWEDYDFWARMAEMGLAGESHPGILAEYRVHETSMMKTQTVVDTNYRKLNLDFARRHPWVALVDTETRRRQLLDDPRTTDPRARKRLDDLLPMLRCPTTGQKLAYDTDRQSLISYDGMVQWPLAAGRPCLSPDLASPQIMPADHISNELPEEALEVIRETKGWVLNLSAGGSREKFPHVVEMEFAVFRHTDIVGDAHHLPFDDHSFDAVVVMNAFEHYHDPVRVAAELHRVLKPGGRLHVRTAFLQPLHEKPYHFYNCTRYGMERWFEAFEAELLHVSANFCPNHTLAWVASEAETALRKDLSGEAADAFLAAPIGQLVDIWRDPSKRDVPLWTDFERLSQDNQEVFAAGFELFGRRRADLPKI